MHDVTVLLSSAGRRGALIGCIRDGAAHVGVQVRLVATDRSPLSAAGHLADAFHLVPSVDDSDFIPTLLAIAAAEDVDVIVPTIDTELRVLADNHHLFASKGVEVLISSPDVITISSDKQRSSRWLAEHGLAIPAQMDRSELGELPPERWPLFYKPVRGSSSIGAQVVRSVDEVDEAFARFGAGVVEEYIVGDEYTLDCWADRDGLCLQAVPRRRLATRAGEISKGVTVVDERLQQETARIVETLPGARGPITVQAIAGPDGPRFIEINARFGGGYPLSHEAGAWYTAVMIAERHGRPIDPAWLGFRGGVVMLRYDESVFVSADRLDTVRPWS